MSHGWKILQRDRDIKKAEILEMKHSMSQIKITVESLNRPGEGKERISDIQDRFLEISQSKKIKLERLKTGFVVYEIPSRDQKYKS